MDPNIAIGAHLGRGPSVPLLLVGDGPGNPLPIGPGPLVLHAFLVAAGARIHVAHRSAADANVAILTQCNDMTVCCAAYFDDRKVGIALDGDIHIVVITELVHLAGDLLGG